MKCSGLYSYILFNWNFSKSYFHRGHSTFSLWFNELWLRIQWITMGTCRIPYKTTNRTGVCNFSNLCVIYWVLQIKGALDNFSLIPWSFFQESWDFYTIRSVYRCNDCMLNLTRSFNLVTKIFEFFLAEAIFKNRLLKMTATDVMTVKFGTIQH